MWKTCDLRKLLIWCFSFFEEDSGKASTKRFIAWILTANASHAIYHTVKNVSVDQWGNSIYFLVSIFGMIASLLAIAYIPSRKDSDPK